MLSLKRATENTLTDGSPAELFRGKPGDQLLGPGRRTLDVAEKEQPRVVGLVAPRLAFELRGDQQRAGLVARQAALDRGVQIFPARDLVLAERHTDAPCGQLDRQWRAGREPVFRHGD